MDYQSNSKKTKQEAVKPDKKIEKVVTGAVVVQKKPLGQKFKDIFIGADFGNVVRYVGAEVMLPAFRNMIVDASTKGIERMMYGETAVRRRNTGPRITYNSPINRGSRYEPQRSIPQRSSRQSREDFILSSREEAESVLERMSDIIDSYDVVSVADLNELVGFPSNHVDNKWGWINLAGSEVRQIREGYLLDLPGPEPI